MMNKILLFALSAVIAFSLFSCTSDNEEPVQTTVAATAEAVLDAFVLDNDVCSVKMLGCGDSILGYKIGVEVENKSSDKEYTFSSSLVASVNGVNCPASFSVCVAPGEKVASAVQLFDSDLKELSVGEYTDISIDIALTEGDGASGAVLYEDLHFYPHGKENATVYGYSIAEGDKVLVDNDAISAILLSAKDDGAFGYSLKLLVYNKSAHNLIVSASDVLANGKEVEASYFAVLNAGVYDIANIVFTPDELASNKISSVEEISFVMSASNAEDPIADKIVSDTLTINLK